MTIQPTWNRHTWPFVLPGLLLLITCTQPPTDLPPHPQEVYDTTRATDAPLVCPFQINIDPMERLLLVNFENDPETLYLGLEPQFFDDTVNGRGLLVIAWRTDGRVDVYHEPTLRLDAGKYDIAGKGLGHLVATPMPRATFDINEQGVQADIQFSDLHGRAIHLAVHEYNPRQRKPFGLLAPMGDAAEHPSAMPLVLLHDFYFVRKHKTDITVRINDRLHQVDAMPMRMDWVKMYFARYSPDPFIVTLNPAHDGPLPALDTAALARELSYNGAVPEIAALSRQGERHTIRLQFEPAFPNVTALRDEVRLQGTFTMTGHPSTGAVSGQYEVTTTGGLTRITLLPDGGWQPETPKLSLKFLYNVNAMFKQWPASYRWTAVITEKETGEWWMQSGWERLR
ncbi:MAG TPA: hypothetical protein PKC76_12250 [Saprospiraceae bacterium]|nr:hypothetical protein [Saprospiraceae bacterium]HMP24899.1 hypothetical protein [Saprospiraceae bacterium]